MFPTKGFFVSRQWGKAFLSLILMFSCLRIGEASNPGPMCVGCINPTGLLSKATAVSGLPHGVWGVAESQLTNQGLSQFRSELNFCKSKFKFWAGKPAHRKSNSLGSVGGKCMGVGVLTDLPARNMQVDWPVELHNEARTHCTAVYVNGIWMKVGVFYGYAKNPKNVLTRKKSDELLSLLTDRIVYNSFGPRIIMGDFNQGIHDLPQTKLWAQEGFVEIQQWAKLRWNYDIHATCKGKTTKDFVWVSREVLPFVADVCVDSTWFADHSIVYAKLTSLPKQEPVPLWRQPKPIPWKEISTPIDDHLENWNAPDVSLLSSDECIQVVMNTMEETADRALKASGKGGLLSSQKGRCTTLEVHCGHHHTSPIKASRSGEFKPSFLGEHFQHQLWLRQLRRLQSLTSLLKSGSLTPSKIDHGTALRQAILAAPGFKGGFQKFWLTKSTHLPNEVEMLPKGIPTYEVAVNIFTAFSNEFKHLEKLLRSEQKHTAKQKRKENPHQIYADIAKSRPLPVQTLVTKHTVTVCELSQDKTKCSVEPEVLPDVPIHSQLGLIDCQMESLTDLKLPAGNSLEIGTVLVQEKWMGSRKEIFDAFENLWNQWWGKHQQVRDEAWLPFVTMCDQVLPTATETMPFPPITIQDWDKVVRHKKSKTATGPDGLSRDDLIHLPVACKQTLVELISKIEQGKPWPKPCMTALISSLEKVESAASPASFRPICVMSLLYRVWASLRARQALKWLVQFAPPELLGSRPKKETANLWFEVAMQIEEGQWFNQEVVGVIADITKCFNSLPRTPIWYLGRKLGLPPQLIQPWCRAVTSLERRFKVDGGVSRSVHATCGLPEGDSLSVVGMFLVNLAFSYKMQSVHPNLTAWTFVDDWQLVGNETEEIIQGIETMKVFVDNLTLELDLHKTYTYGEQPRHLGKS